MGFRAICAAASAGLLLFAAGPLAAQEAPGGDAVDAALPAPLTPEEMLRLADALAIDSAALSRATPARSLRLPALPPVDRFKMSRSDNPDGSGTVALRQALSSEWNAAVGADLGLAAPPPASFGPLGRMPGAAAGGPGHAAWASVGVLPNFATLDARVDPGAEQGRFATTLEHAVPVGGVFSVTLRDSYAVSSSLAEVPTADTGPVWSNERGLRFNILPTGTVLSATLASSSIDPATHHALSAEQRLYGPLRVTTSVTDLGETYASKSISAGFKLNW